MLMELLARRAFFDHYGKRPAEKQADLRAQQYAINAEARQQREAQQLEREKLAAEAAQEPSLSPES